MIFPSLKYIYDAFANTKIKDIGASIIYGSKDFSDDRSSLKLKAEIVTLVVSMKNCKKFIDGKITQDEFVNLSEIYQRDRSAIFHGTSK